MVMKYLKIGMVACLSGLLVLTGCGSDDVLTDKDETLQNTPLVKPLKLTVGTKTSRLIVQDNNGKFDKTNQITNIKGLVWETGDVVWAFSPDYRKANNGGGYTRLICQEAGSSTASFVADGESQYVPGKPLYVYFHGGSNTSSNGVVSGSSIGTMADSTIAYFERPYSSSSSSANQSPELFLTGKDSKILSTTTVKSGNADPFFVYSGYVASAPEDGNVSCSLQSRMPLVGIRLPLLQEGLVSGLTDILGLADYDVEIGCKRANSDKYVFPDQVSLKYNSDGTLTEQVDSWGEPLKFTISQKGLLDWFGQSIALNNGVFYVSIPAIDYKDLRIDVTFNRVSTTSSLLNKLVPVSLVTQTYTFPKKSQTLSFSVDVNNKGAYPANYVYGAGNVMKLSILGIYAGAGEKWETSDYKIVDLNK